jgi:uncharacterized membrane protein YfcA
VNSIPWWGYVIGAGLAWGTYAPLIFCLAPLINTLLSLVWHPDPKTGSWNEFDFHMPGWKLLVGIVLVAAAWMLFVDPWDARSPASEVASVIPWWPALVTGLLVGLLSGLTGTGGGIFLSPLLSFFGWSGARQQAGITAPFILVNSIAGLAGNLVSLQRLPAELPYLVVAALLGGVLGTQLGIRWLSVRALQRALAVVLVIAALKFVLS